MKKILLLFTLAVSLSLAYPQSVLDYVDVFMCTSGDHGQLDPSATVPFGMIKPGPDTDPVNHSGYDYTAEKITGFSHNRIGGVGCSGAGGNLRILPASGEMNISSATFDKKSERGSPGYYSVKFHSGIQAELTATNQTAIHRYTYPKSDKSYLIVDLGSSFAGFIKASKAILNEHEFAATVSARNVCDVGRYTVHYHVWCNKKLELVKEEGNKLTFRFPAKKNEEILLYVTVSPISQEEAKAEWRTRTRDLMFDDVAEAAQKAWTELLSKIEVEGKEEYKTLFYTHLYHIFLNPVKTENRNKQFLATDGEVYASQGYEHYGCWSMWDNFRNKFAVYALIIPDISNDICNSLVDLYRYGEPYWSGFYEPVPTVRTEHTVVTLLDFYRRGVDKFDIEPMYKKLCAEINNISDRTPDTRLEKSYDYWALSEFAEILGKTEDQEILLENAMRYKRTWRRYFLNMGENSDIMHGDGLYEGTLWQYRWHVQFDFDGIIEMIGSKEKYTEELEYFFENHLYNHGNQPDIQVPFMFNYGTKPWLTQKWVNKILTKDMYQYYGTHEKWDEPYYGRIYKADPVGYIPEMDDDEGTMSGWYVLSAMGIYPVEVGRPHFQISSPIFDKIKIHLPEGKTFEIITHNLSDDNFYIKDASLNGKQFNQTYINNSDIVNGGVLIFNLSDVPNESFGVGR